MADDKIYEEAIELAIKSLQTQGSSTGKLLGDSTQAFAAGLARYTRTGYDGDVTKGIAAIQKAVPGRSSPETIMQDATTFSRFSNLADSRYIASQITQENIEKLSKGDKGDQELATLYSQILQTATEATKDNPSGLEQAKQNIAEVYLVASQRYKDQIPNTQKYKEEQARFNKEVVQPLIDSFPPALPYDERVAENAVNNLGGADYRVREDSQFYKNLPDVQVKDATRESIKQGMEDLINLGGEDRRDVLMRNARLLSGLKPSDITEDNIRVLSNSNIPGAKERAEAMNSVLNASYGIDAEPGTPEFNARVKGMLNAYSAMNASYENVAVEQAKQAEKDAAKTAEDTRVAKAEANQVFDRLSGDPRFKNGITTKRLWETEGHNNGVDMNQQSFETAFGKSGKPLNREDFVKGYLNAIFGGVTNGSDIREALVNEEEKRRARINPDTLPKMRDVSGGQTVIAAGAALGGGKEQGGPAVGA